MATLAAVATRLNLIMSSVTLLNIEVVNNPAKFTDPYEFEITFECLGPLKEDLEWKLVYVGSAESTQYDQELECLLVGPVPVGVNKFRFTANAPSADLIPPGDLLSVTVILLTCAYREKVFVQVGYFVNNEYDTEELRENPPSRPQLDHVVRNVLTEKPKVTRYSIPWDNENESEFPPEQPDVDVDTDEEYGNEDEDRLDELADERDEQEADAEDDDDEVDDNDDAEDEEDEGDEDEGDEDVDLEAPEPKKRKVAALTEKTEPEDKPKEPEPAGQT